MSSFKHQLLDFTLFKQPPHAQKCLPVPKKSILFSGEAMVSPTGSLPKWNKKYFQNALLGVLDFNLHSNNLNLAISPFQSYSLCHWYPHAP